MLLERKRASLKNAMKLGACAALLLAPSAPRVLAAPENGAPAKRASQSLTFSTVPAGDPLYENLAAIERANWIQGGATSAAHPLLTRYEIAVETAKAIFYTGARHESDPSWLAATPRGSLRALRDLCKSLKGELGGMGVEVRPTLTMIDDALQGKVRERARAAEQVISAEGAMETPLGAALIRAANDPVLLARDQRLRASTSAFSGGESGRDWRFRLTPWMALRAGYGSRDLASPLAMNDVPLTGAERVDAVGGGVDLALARNLSLSGRVENVAALAGENNPSWLRYSGRIGVTTLGNRLSLSANMARLVPQDATAAAATAAGVNLDLGISDRLKLKVLYQQLFGNAAVPTGNVRVAGGVSLNF